MVGFSASIRSIYALHRESNCSWWTQMGSRDQKNTKIRDNFDHGSTTNGTMAKRRPQLYSAHRIGLYSLHRNSNCSCWTSELILIIVHNDLTYNQTYPFQCSNLFLN